MTMQNDQNRRSGFLENAMGHGSFVVVAIIAVVFVSMVYIFCEIPGETAIGT